MLHQLLSSAGPKHGDRRSARFVLPDLFNTWITNLTGLLYGSNFLSCTLYTSQATTMERSYEWLYRAICAVNTGLF